MLYCIVMYCFILYCTAHTKFITPRRSVLYSTSPYFNYWLTLRFCTITVRNIWKWILQYFRVNTLCFSTLHCTALYFHGLNHKVLTCVEYRAVSASSKILTPLPLSTQRVCPPPAPKAGGTHSPGGEGWGVNILEDASTGLASYSIIPLRTTP